MPMLVITLTLTGIVWLVQSLRFIDYIVNQGIDVSMFLYISLLMIPLFLFSIFPVALFVSVLMVYNKFISDSELIVLKSAGLSRINLAIPALIVALFVTAISYFISAYLLPASYREFKDTEVFIRNNYASALLQDGVFSNPTKGLTIYIESRGREGLLNGILAHNSRNPEKPMTIMAEEGILYNTANGPRIDFINGHIQQIAEKTGNLEVLDFEKYEFDLSMYTKASERNWRTTEESYIHELLFPYHVSEKLHKKFIAEGHYRLVWPLFSLVLALVAIAALFSGQFNRRGQWKRILSATIISFIIVLLNLGAKSAATASSTMVVLMYLNVLLAVCSCLYIIIANRTINGFPIIDKIQNKLRSLKANKQKGQV